MASILRPALAVAALFALAGCGSRAAPDLHVLSFSPTARDNPQQPLQLQFSAPAVPQTTVGTVLAASPIALSPSHDGVQLSARWTDRQTLAVTVAGLHPATHYAVTLQGPLSERTVDKHFSFVEAPLVLLGIPGPVAPATRMPSNGFDLQLTFNWPVQAQEAAAKCALLANGQSVRLKPVLPEQMAPTVTLRAPPLAPGSTHHLHCADVMPAQGDAPLLLPFDATLTVADAFAVQEIVPDNGARIAPDETRLHIKFTTPVDSERVAEAVHLQPPAPGLTSAWIVSDEDAHEAVLDLEPSTHYTLTIDKGLRDAFGQPLALDVSPTYAFDTGNGKPRMRLDRGVVTVEAGRAGPLLWTRNLASVHVRCAAIAAEKAANVLTKSARVITQSWYGERDTELDWRGLPVREFDLPVAGEVDKWHKQALDLPGACGRLQRGLVMAEVTSSELTELAQHAWGEPARQRILVNVTDIGLVVKTGVESGLVWAVGLHDGKALAGADARVFAATGVATAHGKTDSVGLWRLPGSATLLGPAEKNKDVALLEGADRQTRGTGDLLFVVSRGDDFAVTMGDWNQGLYPWSFGVPYSWNGAKSTKRGVLFTDRGIYRPGETAHFKGIIREVTAEGMKVPLEQTAHVRIVDPRDAIVFEKDVPVSAFGGFWLDVDVPAEAALGDWSVAAAVGDATLAQQFLVAEFRKQTFEVKVSAPKPEPGSREPLSFAVDARYLFGAPVANAAVQWRMTTRPHALGFAGYDDWSFERDREWDQGDESSGNVEPAAEGTGTTDADGKLQFAFKPGKEDGSGPVAYVVAVEVVDAANDAVTGRAMAVVYPSTVYVGLQSAWMAEAKQPLAVRAVALHPDGSPARTAATLQLLRDEWVCKPSRHHTEDDDNCTQVTKPVLEQAVTISGAQTALAVTPPEPGSYRIVLRATDPAGHVVQASTWLWAHGAGASGWQPSAASKMEVVASQHSFKPGDTARILARTSLSGGLALLTLERAGVLDARVQPLRGAAEPLDFHLTAENAPNVIASVVVAQGRRGPEDKQRPRLQMGVVNLPVVAADRRLKVTVTTARESYEPGEEVTATVKVMAGDEPVVGEVALSVADEGVLQLIAFKTPDPHDPMYAPWEWAVTTATNWNNLLRPSDPRINDPDEGGDGAAATQVRKRFLSSAFWAPALQTAADGTVTVHFAAPDNLTAFRVMAMAADNAARFGSGERRFTVKKPVQAQPTVPRFLVPGDRAELGVLVHNHTGAAGEALVRATATGMTLERTETRVQVASDGSLRVPFMATVLPGDKATLRFDVTLGQARDSVEVELPVVERLTIDRTLAGSGRAEKSASLEVKWPESGYVASASRLEIAVDRTGMAALQPALKALIAYPYGCLEQTLSRFVPLAKVKELANVAGLDGLNGPALEKYLAAGAAKLLHFQDASGHFSLWPGGHGEAHYTVYAMQGVLEAHKAGVPVDKMMVTNGLRALANWAAQQTKVTGDRDTVALVIAADVLGEMGVPDAGLTARLFEARHGLPRFAQGYLLRALFVGKAPAKDVQTLLTELEASVRSENDAAWLVDRDRGDDDWWWPTDHNVRPTAALLQTLLLVRPKHPLIPRLAQYLLASAHADGAWANTHDNAYAITALAAWAQAQAKGTAHVTLRLADKTLAERTLHGHDALSLALPLGDLRPGTLTLQTDTPVRYLTRVVVARRDDKALAVDRGFAVTRRYLDAATNKELTQVRLGQLVKVELAVTTPLSRRDVALVDPLPAGFEGANLRINDNEVTAHPTAFNDWEGRWWTWQWTEQHDDEVRAFADRLEAGRTTYRYLARALIAGTFTAAPTTVEAMYEPDVHGRAAGVTVGVQ